MKLARSHQIKNKINLIFKSRDKNVSSKVKIGTVIMTRDEYFLDNNNYVKPEYANKPNILYREAIAVDTNKQNHLALIKLQSNGKHSVLNKSMQEEKYNPYIKIFDNEGKPITLNEKFKRGNPKYDVNEKTANKMKQKALKNKNISIRKQNIEALKILKK